VSKKRYKLIVRIGQEVPLENFSDKFMMSMAFLLGAYPNGTLVEWPLYLDETLRAREMRVTLEELP
jgi:hypothetical protein